MTDTALTADATVAQHGVLLTDAAAEKVKSLLQQEGRDDLRLRVAVQPGGCSGLIYQLFFDERILDGDRTVDFGGVEVVVDEMSTPYLDGASIVVHSGPDDYRTDPAGNSGARIACGVLH